MKEKPIYICITPFFPSPDNWRGAYVLDQVKAIYATGIYEVLVIKVAAAWTRMQTYYIEGIKVITCSDYNLPSYMFPNRLTDWLSGLSLEYCLLKNGVDFSRVRVCHCHVASNAHYALTLKKKCKKSIAIVQHHGFDVFGYSDGKFAKYKWHKNICIKYGIERCNSMDINIGVSNATLKYVHSYVGISLKNEYVLYNGVDVDLFYPPKKKSVNKIFTIGCVANFWPLKDQATLIKAINELVKKGMTNIKVIFVGSGMTLKDCQKLITANKLEDYFEFRSEVKHDKLVEYYQSLDLFVLPSYWEAFGCVYAEAYACGVPFIAVKGQGIAEIVSDPENWLIDKGDYAQLAHLIECQAKTKRIQRLTVDIAIESLIKNYLQYINEML